MSAGTAAVRARYFAELQMRSACVVERKTGDLLTDSETGNVTEARTAVYAGKCRIRPASSLAQAAFETIGDEQFRFDYVVTIPFAVTGIRPGDRVTVISSPDPDLVGMEVEVQKPTRGDDVSARRLACQEVS